MLSFKRGQKINGLNVQLQNLGEHKISPKNISRKQIINKRQRIISQKTKIFNTSNKKNLETKIQTTNQRPTKITLKAQIRWNSGETDNELTREE